MCVCVCIIFNQITIIIQINFRLASNCFFNFIPRNVIHINFHNKSLVFDCSMYMVYTNNILGLIH